MDSMMAFAMGEANRGKDMMVFDWDKAARLILKYKAVTASAGLRSDWGYTGGEIFSNGKANSENYTYLASTWAVPEIDIDGSIYECYMMESNVPLEWGDDYAHIKWPGSAIAILLSGV